MKKHDLLIVENHSLTRQTLAYQIKKLEKINLTGTCENGAQAVQFVEEQKPEIILMDIDMPVMDGIEATLRIKKKYPKINIIMLTAYSERQKVLGAFNSGANAYCIKDIKMGELSKVIDIVLEGGIWFDTKIAGFIYDVMQHLSEEQKKETVKADDFNISEREKEVLKCVSDGMSNAEICEKLFISKNTVKNHIASIIDKLSVKDRTQAAVFALKNNFFE